MQALKPRTCGVEGRRHLGETELGVEGDGFILWESANGFVERRVEPSEFRLNGTWGYMRQNFQVNSCSGPILFLQTLRQDGNMKSPQDW